jgi:hypothetical protein
MLLHFATVYSNPDMMFRWMTTMFKYGVKCNMMAGPFTISPFSPCVTSVNEWGPRMGWSQSSGWRAVKGILSIVIDATAGKLAPAPFLVFSLDESNDTAGAFLFFSRCQT